MTRILVRNPDKGYLDTSLHLPKSLVNTAGLKSALTISNGGEDLRLYKETVHHLTVPRSFCPAEGYEFPIIDCRPRSYTRTGITSNIVLDAQNPLEHIQGDAVQKLLEARGGLLVLSCGRGKSVCAMDFIAKVGGPALIVVHNTQLLEQWQGEIGKFLNVPGGVGLYMGDNTSWKKGLVLSTFQTLFRRAEKMELPEEMRRWFEVIIWDETQHLSAPKFSLTADQFYGRRYGLTATPVKEDGSHIVYNYHLGGVLYKNLTQAHKPEVFFYWTGVTADLSDPSIKKQVCDVTGEWHIFMLAAYLGRTQSRLELILQELTKAVDAGRKVLVLSCSLEELGNLYALWCGIPAFTDSVAYPTKEDIGEVDEPLIVDVRTLGKYRRSMFNAQKNMGSNKAAADAYAFYKQKLHQHEVHEKLELEYEKRRVKYFRDAIKGRPIAGLLVGAIPPKERQQMLREKQVVFSISSYGQEGMDERMIDTVFICEPMKQRNYIQQVMGRALRTHGSEKQRIIVIFEDDIPIMQGICGKLRRHFREWPLEEQGPIQYSMLNYPNHTYQPLANF